MDFIEQYVEKPSDVLTRAYVKLRDQRDELRQREKEIIGKMTILEKVFQLKLEQLQQDSFNAGGYNVSKSTLVTMVVTDREEFFTFVRENEAYDLLEARCAKDAALIYASNNENELPPGTEKHEKVRVNVKKSSKGRKQNG